MSDGDQSVEVITTITLRDGASIKSKTGRLSISSEGTGAFVSFWVESPAAADELAEALKGVAAGIREKGGAD